MTNRSFDFANDPALSGLPLALRQRMTEVQQARIDAGFTAKNGVTYRTAARCEWINDLLDWHEAGKPEEGFMALEDRRVALRAAGDF